MFEATDAYSIAACMCLFKFSEITCCGVISLGYVVDSMLTLSLRATLNELKVHIENSSLSSEMDYMDVDSVTKRSQAWQLLSVHHEKYARQVVSLTAVAIETGL
ncbi:hypothetical protein AVEN_58988-1 [Araneus ventricosus]|uniref:Uncharacterized protein n=1 Tax=Araneus ventricosus TaxID=182803 RepID=A0A4Y2EKM0_ARAVE|nr:hypothetical protein AVEN_58988-1 [Araneus ventricosus]